MKKKKINIFGLKAEVSAKQIVLRTRNQTVVSECSKNQRSKVRPQHE